MIVGLTVTEGAQRARLLDVLRALDHRISPVDNWQAKVLGPITTPGTADTEFAVDHNLGIVPTAYIVNVNANAVVYDSRRVDWTTSQLFLKCSQVSVTVFLIVM